MNYPADLKYTKTHEWVKFENETTIKMGLSDFAQKSLGSIVFVNLPEMGDEAEAGSSFGEVESVKAVSDMYSPVTGSVSAVNEEVMDSPEKVNEDPYGSWLVEISDISAVGELMDASEYKKLCEEEEV